MPTPPSEPENAYHQHRKPPRLSARDIEHVCDYPRQYCDSNQRHNNDDALL